MQASNPTPTRARRTFIRSLLIVLPVALLVLAPLVRVNLAGSPDAKPPLPVVAVPANLAATLGGDAPSTADAFLELRPGVGAPPNGGTAQVGDRFVLELWLNAGSNPDAVGQQSYLTFSTNLLQNARVSTIGTSCVLTSTVTGDFNTFDSQLQNQVCNGGSPCGTIPASSIAFASGALNNPPAEGEFRVAQVGICSVGAGSALLHWQFSPPDPPNRNTKITNANGDSIQNQTLFADYSFTVLGNTTPTNTPAPSSTGTPTATVTYVPPTTTPTYTPPPSDTATVTSTRTPTSTSTTTNTPTSPPTSTGTNTGTTTPTSAPTFTATQTAAPTNTSTSTATSTNTTTSTRTSTPSSTSTFTATATSTQTNTATSTRTVTATTTSTYTTTSTATSTATLTPTTVPTNSPTTTSTATATAINTATATASATATPSSTAILPTFTVTRTATNAPTNTPLSTSTATNTAIPTSTPTITSMPSTATNTSTHTPTVAPTNTTTNTSVPPTSTATNTAIPTNTPTHTSVPTNTPSYTYTSTNTATSTPSSTSVPPTGTPTNTPSYTNTPSSTPTNTSVPPTHTPTNTAVEPTDTATYTPSNTPTSTLTNTPTDTPTNTPTRTATTTNTPTNTPTNANTSTNTPVNTPTNTNTLTNTPTAAPTNTSTRTAIATNTPIQTPSNTSTWTPTNTATPTPLPTQTTGGATATLIATGTTIDNPTNTPVDTPTQTPGEATTTPALSVTPTVCTLQFTDVAPDSTFYSYVRCMACRGIVNGYTTGCAGGSPCFKPNNNVTRGQLAKIVSNSAGFQDPPSARLFQDVPPGSAFYDYSFRLASRGIIGGYACGGPGEPCVLPGNLPYFRPSSNATRGQISKIVSNAAGYNDPPVGQTFQDVSPGSTFYTFTQRLTARSIMQGYTCGGAGEPCVPPNSRPYFMPNNNATRGQTSKILANTFFPNCQTPSNR